MKVGRGFRWVAVAALALSASRASSAQSCWTIVGARVADGTGTALRSASVEVCGDTISRVGAFRPPAGDRVVDGRGLVLAPGFIDIHNHATEGLARDPAAESQVSQGITTLVVGADGESPWPIAGYLGERRARPAAVNILALVGHATVREKVMGPDFRRAARPDEVVAMAELVDQGMREGAVGLSSGLEYEVGSYSETPELVALARASARHGGFYMTHIRDEADKSFEAFGEAIRIGREAGSPVQISHIKLATVNVWGKAREAVRLFENARASGLDVTADCYPYTAWHANIEVLVPNKKYDDPESVARALADVGGAGNVTITGSRAHPEYVGRNLEALAAAQSTTPVELFIRIVKEGGADVIGHSMKEEDVESFYRQPWVMVASDGGIGSSHPRGTGTFPKVLGRYVREKRLFSLSEAIRKMTSLPARRLKLSDRGRIARGMKADLVLFDPITVVDRSTFEDPAVLSVGIRLVVVNGRPVWENGKSTGKAPGRVLPETARAAGSPTDAGGVPAAQVDSIFRRFDESDSPGCALAVVTDGRIVYQRGYGMASLELSVPITPETVFDIGSAEKQFAAALMVLLEEEGKLSLDDDIRKFLPEIPDYGTPITIRHLLHHTSGLRDYIGLLWLAGYRYEDVTTDEDAMLVLSRQKGLDFPPGSRQSYSNSGYFLLSQIVRRATGRTLGELVQERILRPLHMSSSSYLADHTQIVARRAASYAPGQEGGFVSETSNWEQTGDGGLQTTVLDLVKWDANFYDPKVGGQRLASALQTAGSLSDGRKLPYALGLRVDKYRGLKRVSHGGSWAGFRAQLMRFPQQRFSAIVLCNLSSSQPGELARKVAELYLEKEMRPVEKPLTPAPPPAAVSAVEIGPESGLYWDPESDDLLRIRAEKGRLLARHGEGKEYELLPAGTGRFVRKEDPDSVFVVSKESTGERALRLESKEEPPSLYRGVAEWSPSPAALAGYAGDYDSAELDVRWALELENGRLRLRRRGANVSTLKPVFADAFSETEVGLLRFQRDREGRVKGFAVASGLSKISFARLSEEKR